MDDFADSLDIWLIRVLRTLLLERSVTQTAQRRSEAARLGYTDLIDNRSLTVRGALDDVKTRSRGVPGKDVPEF